MLTNEDIKKLIETQKEVFATKEDISKLATKEDLAKLVTLEEFGQFRVEVNQNFAKVVTLEEFDQFRGEIKQDLDALRESIQALTISVDRLVKAIDTLNTEYAAIVKQINRHEKWLQQVAEKLGMSLEY